MRRGKVVKALTPVTRPFCDRQVRGLRDCANREGGIRGSLLHRAPVPLPVALTPPLHSLDANGWGPRSPRNGRSQLQWRFLRPGTHCLGGALRPRRGPGVLRPRPLPGEASGRTPFRSKSTPSRQPKLFISYEVKSLSRVLLFVTHGL